MKFECDSCGAGYKISDDKVAGRVVRFRCRRCNHKILLDGTGMDSPGARARAAAVASPIRRQSTGSPRPSRKPRRTNGSTASKLPRGDAVWHVSINDVPVGPIKLEELAHKIDAGAVSEYSLVWRRDFDEWRPLATVPELISLISARRASRPSNVGTFSSLPPVAESRTSVAEPPAMPQNDVETAPQPRLSDPVYRPTAVSKPYDRFDVPTVDSPVYDPFDQPTVSSLLDDQPTVSSLVDDQPTVSSLLDDQPTVSSLVDDQPTVSSHVDEQPTIASLSDDHPTLASIAEDPFSSLASTATAPNPFHGTTLASPEQSERNGSSGAYASVITASAFAVPPSVDEPASALSTAPTGAPPSAEPIPPTPSPTRPSFAGQPTGYVDARSAGTYPSVPSAPQPVHVREGMSVWAWAMVASFAAFAGVFAVLAFNKLFNERQLASAPVTAPVVAPTEPAPPPVTPPAEEGFATVPEQATVLDANSFRVVDEEPDMEFGLDEPGLDESAPPEAEPTKTKPPKRAATKRASTKRKARRRAKSSSTRTGATKLSGGEPAGIRKLGEESPQSDDAKLLAKFDGSGGTPATIKVKESGSTQAKRKPLDSKALSTVVNKNKPRLQRCYERAIRGHQDPPTVRMDVQVSVAPSGRVTSAKADGVGPGGLSQCIQSLVKRWRFPVSPEPVQTRFPVVFSPN